MKNVILYVASSLDGYVATPDHGVKWLEALENPDGTDYGYQDFIAGIDTIIMGRKSYEIVRNFDMAWPYSDKQVYIVSRQHDLSIDTPNTQLLTGDLVEEIEKLKNVWGDKNIWLLGGGLTTRSLLEHQCIEELMLFTAPVLLGEGIPLFPASKIQIKLSLIDQKTYPSGMTFNHYRINKE